MEMEFDLDSTELPIDAVRMETGINFFKPASPLLPLFSRLSLSEARPLVSAAKSGAAGRASSGSGRLAGKVAIITGVASGIGKATVAEFVRNGAKVVIADVQDDLGRDVATELGGPDMACYARCNVTDEALVAAAVDLAVARHGRLDVMFNNAGVTGGNYAGGPIESMDMADFDRVMAINLRGVAAGIKHVVRAMVPHGAGCILCTSNTTGALGGSGLHAYNVSKTAVVGMVRSAAAELAARGVRVNAISPYAIETSMGSRGDDGAPASGGWRRRGGGCNQLTDPCKSSNLGSEGMPGYWSGRRRGAERRSRYGQRPKASCAPIQAGAGRRPLLHKIGTEPHGVTVVLSLLDG